MKVVLMRAPTLVAVAFVCICGAALGAEFSPPYPNGFHGTSRKPMRLETVGGFALTCQVVTMSGAITGPHSLSTYFTYEGCSYPYGECRSRSESRERETEPELVEPPFAGTLGDLNASRAGVGVDLVPPNGAIEEFGCGEDTGVRVEGSVVAGLSQVEPRVLRIAMHQKGGRQSPKRLYGGPLDVPMTRLAVGGGEWNTAPVETGMELIELLHLESTVRVSK